MLTAIAVPAQIRGTHLESTFAVVFTVSAIFLEGVATVATSGTPDTQDDPGTLNDELLILKRLLDICVIMGPFGYYY